MAAYFLAAWTASTTEKNASTMVVFTVVLRLAGAFLEQADYRARPILDTKSTGREIENIFNKVTNLEGTSSEEIGKSCGISTTVDGTALRIPVQESYCKTVVESGQFLFRLNSTYFHQEPTSAIIGYHIVLAPSSFENFDPNWFKTTISYRNAAADQFRMAFYVTNIWAPLHPFTKTDTNCPHSQCCHLTSDDQQSCGDGEYSSIDILIGDSSCQYNSSQHCIGLLPKGESFWVGVLAILNESICTNGTVDWDNCSALVYLNSTIITISVDSKMTTDNLTITGNKTVGMAGGIIAGIALGLIAVTALLIWKRRRDRGEIQSNGIQKTGKSRRINLSEFELTVLSLTRNSAFSMLEELETLCELSPSIHQQTRAVGLKEENVRKNRYVDVIPFDKTRVKLNGDRYINASFIKGFNRSKEYIATQGPLGEEDRRIRGKYSTLDDLFELIWQYNVRHVIMLTQLQENGRPKCAQYWPRSVGNAVQHGVFTIVSIREENYGTFWKRELELKQSNETRYLYQYQYKTWSDMMVTNENELLAFIRYMREMLNVTRPSSPLLVHCSAGCGRTGVFIALDILLQHIQRYSWLDIADCVYNLRQQRVRMVQTEDQYIMLYKTMGIAVQELLQSSQSSYN